MNFPYFENSETFNRANILQTCGIRLWQERRGGGAKHSPQFQNLWPCVIHVCSIWANWNALRELRRGTSKEEPLFDSAANKIKARSEGAFQLDRSQSLILRGSAPTDNRIALKMSRASPKIKISDFKRLPTNEVKDIKAILKRVDTTHRECLSIMEGKSWQ